MCLSRFVSSLVACDKFDSERNVIEIPTKEKKEQHIKGS